MKQENIDAYMVVYSVEDRRSFEAAINRLYEIRYEIGNHVALILVANKTDLVRSRIVTDEGKLQAPFGSNVPTYFYHYFFSVMLFCVNNLQSQNNHINWQHIN